jgi:hypothetical protein
MKKLPCSLVAAFLAWGAVPAGAEAGSARGLAILAPAAERTVVEDGAVMISVAPDPALAQGEAIVLRVDDDLVVVLPAGVTRFALKGVPPGSHLLEAIIVDADTELVAAAAPVRFMVGPGLRI